MSQYAQSDLQYAGEFQIEEFKLFSSTGKFIYMDTHALRINIHESIFSNAISGEILMFDTDNLITNFPIIGQETLSIKFKTPNFEEDENHFNFTEHKFAVFGVGLSTDASHGSNVHILKFCSPELLKNLQTRVSRSYTQSISDTVGDLLTNTKYVGTTKKIITEPTTGIRKYVCPNHHPYTIVNHLLNQSVSKETGSPHYLFFENTLSKY